MFTIHDTMNYIKFDLISENIEVDKNLRQTTLFSLAIGFLLITLMLIKYLISEFLIISEANYDIDTEEM